jgi:tetratricopeptide (TPR) repeat protein
MCTLNYVTVGRVSNYEALGVAYVMAGELKAAVRSFKAALTLSPDMREALQSLSNVLLKQGEAREVIDLVSVYLQRQPSDIKARELLSQAYFRIANYGAARLQLTSALQYVVSDSESDKTVRARLLNNICVCFDRQGDLENTIHWVQRSLATERRFDPIPHLNLARLLMRKRQFDSALRTLDVSRSLFPNNHEIPEVQSIVLAEQGHTDKAVQLLQSELASGKATAGSFANLGYYLAEFKDQPDQAIQVMTQGLEAYPQSPEVSNNLAYVLLMSGHPVEARSILEPIDINGKHIKPENRVTLTATWGLLFLWEGDLIKGRQYYDHAAQLAFALGRTDSVAAVHQKAHLELAKAFLRQNKIEEAILEVKQGQSIGGGRPDFEEDLDTLREQIENK